MFSTSMSHVFALLAASLFASVFAASSNPPTNYNTSLSVLSTTQSATSFTILSTTQPTNLSAQPIQPSNPSLLYTLLPASFTHICYSQVLRIFLHDPHTVSVLGKTYILPAHAKYLICFIRRSPCSVLWICISRHASSAFPSLYPLLSPLLPLLQRLLLLKPNHSVSYILHWAASDDYPALMGPSAFACLIQHISPIPYLADFLLLVDPSPLIQILTLPICYSTYFLHTLDFPGSVPGLPHTYLSTLPYASFFHRDTFSFGIILLGRYSSVPLSSLATPLSTTYSTSSASIFFPSSLYICSLFIHQRGCPDIPADLLSTPSFFSVQHLDVSLCLWRKILSLSPPSYFSFSTLSIRDILVSTKTISFASELVLGLDPCSINLQSSLSIYRTSLLFFSASTKDTPSSIYSSTQTTSLYLSLSPSSPLSPYPFSLDHLAKILLFQALFSPDTFCLTLYLPSSFFFSLPPSSAPALSFSDLLSLIRRILLTFVQIFSPYNIIAYTNISTTTNTNTEECSTPLTISFRDFSSPGHLLGAERNVSAAAIHLLCLILCVPEYLPCAPNTDRVLLANGTGAQVALHAREEPPLLAVSFEGSRKVLCFKSFYLPLSDGV